MVSADVALPPSSLVRNVLAAAIAMASLFASLILYFEIGHWSEHFVGTSSFAVAAFCGLTCFLQDRSPLYVIRYGLLFITGCIPAIFLVWGTPDTHVTYLARWFQHPHFATLAINLTAIAVSAHALGWLIFSRYTSHPTLKPDDHSKTSSPFWVYLSVSVIAGQFVAASLGPFIWQAAYSIEASAPFLNIGAFPVVAVLGLLGAYATLLNENSSRFSARSVALIAASIYVLLFCMFFRGMRVEVVSAVAGFIGVNLIYRDRRLKLFRLLVLGLGFYAFVIIWGAYRANAIEGFSLADAASLAFHDMGKQYHGGQGYYHFGTLGDLAGTFFNSLGAIEGIGRPHLHGSGYLDYIPRSLPQFIYPDRPMDLAWYFFQIGEWAGGGIFELAEAYLNFGAWGCFLIPFALGALFASAETRARNARTSFWLMVYACLMASVFRGTLYQTFSFYKSFLVLITIQCLVVFAQATESKLKPLIVGFMEQ